MSDISIFTRATNALKTMAVSETHLQARITAAWFSLQAISPGHITDPELSVRFKSPYEKHNSGGQGATYMSNEEAEIQIEALVQLCADLIQYAA